MPTLADLRVRYGASSRASAAPADADEILVADSRSRMSPAQMVEQKLRRVLSAGRTAARMAALAPRKVVKGG